MPVHEYSSGPSSRTPPQAGRFVCYQCEGVSVVAQAYAGLPGPRIGSQDCPVCGGTGRYGSGPVPEEDEER